jgi:hypothetical protein
MTLCGKITNSCYCLGEKKKLYKINLFSNVTNETSFVSAFKILEIFGHLTIFEAQLYE